jgi:hypothetical protein
MASDERSFLPRNRTKLQEYPHVFNECLPESSMNVSQNMETDTNIAGNAGARGKYYV